jgi:hypothetical protein
MRDMFTLLAKTCLAAILPLAAPAQNTNATVSVLSDTNAIHNFKVALLIPKTTFTNGEPVLCQAGLTNVSEVPTLVFPSVLELNLKFCVTNERGVQIHPFDFDYSAVRFGGLEVVPPHGVEYGRPFALNKYFQMSPGSYRIAVTREFGYPLNDVVFTSSVVTLKILDSPLSSATNAAPRTP